MQKLIKFEQGLCSRYGTIGVKFPDLGNSTVVLKDNILLLGNTIKH